MFCKPHRGRRKGDKKCLNVRQKLGTWKFFNVFLRFPMFSNVFQCYLLSSHYLTLTLFQSLIESLLTCWTTFVFISMLKSHSHALSLSHSFNLSFNHSWHAEQVLFSSLCSKFAVYRWKLQCIFWDLHHHITLPCDTWVHRAGSQIKKLFIMSRESEWEIETVWEWERVRVREWERVNECESDFWE